MKVCNFPDCGREQKSKGYCSSHYRQQHEGKELRPLRSQKRYPAPAPGKKICNVCETVKDVEEFYMRTNGKTRHAECKECTIKRTQASLARRKANERRDYE